MRSLNQQFGAAIAERDLGWMCAYCYKLLDPSHAGMYKTIHYTVHGTPYEWGAFYDDQPCVDHVVPSSLGGPDDIENYVLSCRSCNSKKRNRLPGEF